MGSAQDVIMVGVLLFTLGLGFFIIYFAFDRAFTDLLAVPALNETQGVVDSFEAGRALLNRLDYVVFAVFIGLVLAVIITGWLVGGRAIFMAIYFLVIMLAVVFSSIFANVWEQITQSTAFGITISAFPITNHLLLYLPIYTVAVGFFGMVVMFAKPYFAGEGGYG